MAFSPDGKNLASAGLDIYLRVWDLSTGKEVRRLVGDSSVFALQQFVMNVTYSPDGNEIISGGADMAVRIWACSAAEGTRGHRRTITTGTGAVHAVAFSPDGKEIATGSGLNDPIIQFWSRDTAREVRRFRADSIVVLSAAYRPDGRQLVTTSPIGVSVWATDSGKQLKHLFGHSGMTTSSALSVDGSEIASAGWIRLYRPGISVQERTHRN